MGNGFLFFLQNGGVAVYPLLLCSVLGLAVILERAFYLAKAFKSLKILHPTLLQLSQKGDFKKAESLAKQNFLTSLFLKGIAQIGQPESRIAAVVQKERQEEVQNLRNRIWILGTIGSLAPFIGLFGTVVGIMHAFREIAQSQEGGFSTVSAGISEALIATAAGIFVGVVSVAAYNFFSNKINQISFRLKSNGEDLTYYLSGQDIASYTLAEKE